MDPLPRFADPRIGRCGRPVDGEFCRNTPAPFVTRLGRQGRIVARLCRPCAEWYRRRLSELREKGLTMTPEIVIDHDPVHPHTGG